MNISSDDGYYTPTETEIVHPFLYPLQNYPIIRMLYCIFWISSEEYNMNSNSNSNSNNRFTIFTRDCYSTIIYDNIQKLAFQIPNFKSPIELSLQINNYKEWRCWYNSKGHDVEKISSFFTYEKSIRIRNIVKYFIFCITNNFDSLLKKEFVVDSIMTHYPYSFELDNDILDSETKFTKYMKNYVEILNKEPLNNQLIDIEGVDFRLDGYIYDDDIIDNVNDTVFIKSNDENKISEYNMHHYTDYNYNYIPTFKDLNIKDHRSFKAHHRHRIQHNTFQRNCFYDV